MEEEKKDSLATFFILLVLVLAILLVHLLIITEFHYMPESLAIVLLGRLQFPKSILHFIFQELSSDYYYLTQSGIGVMLNPSIQTSFSSSYFLQLSSKVDTIFIRETSLRILSPSLHMLLLGLLSVLSLWDSRFTFWDKLILFIL